MAHRWWPFRARALWLAVAVSLLIVLHNVITQLRTPPNERCDPAPSEPPPPVLSLPPCWVTGISTPNNKKYLLSSLILGHSLRRHGNTPNAKLLLLIAAGTNWSTPITDAIFQVYDDVLTFPVHPIPGGRKPVKDEPEYLFKMWAFTLHDKCSTVAWLGADTLPIRDMQHVLTCWPLPCGAPDLTLWKFYQLGPAINGDIITFAPSPELYDALIKAWAETPINLLGNWREGGPFDQGVLNRFFKGNMTILPWFYNVQPKALMITGGARGTQVAKLTGMWSLIHFSNSPKPWDTTPPVPKPNATLSADEQLSATTLRLWREACRRLVEALPVLTALGHCKTGTFG